MGKFLFDVEESPRKSSRWIFASVYYYFYERSRETILRSKSEGKSLSTLESMLTGLIAGPFFPLSCLYISIESHMQVLLPLSSAIRYGWCKHRRLWGPWEQMPANRLLWRSLDSLRQYKASSPKMELGVSCDFYSINWILSCDFSAFWRGIGPALVLVMNPIIQYTAFEQLKNFLIARRTSKLRAAGAAATAVAVLSDLDFFFLGALSKLGILFLCFAEYLVSLTSVAQLPRVLHILTCPCSFSRPFDVTHWRLPVS